jgi:hypothetical protein
MYRSALYVCFAVLMLAIGCANKPPKLSEEEQAVASFQQIAKDYVNIYNQSKHEQVRHRDELRSMAVVVPGGWWKVYSEIADDPKIDVRRTDSLVSPYVGTLDFYVSVHATESMYGSQDSASQATDFSSKHSLIHHLRTYAYQNGAWVLQSRKYLDDANDEGWQDCPDGE